MLNQINITLFNTVNKFSGNNLILDKLMIVLAEYLPYVFILILLYLWFQRKEDKDIVLLATYSAALGIMVDFIIGLFYFHSRPFMDGIGNNLVKHVAESSFPSDHTTFMLSIAFLLFYFSSRRKWGASLLALGIFGGVARVYTGVHYPGDILGSVLVAISSSLLIFFLAKKLQLINDFIIKVYETLFRKMRDLIGKNK